jgi:hypothetical protein
LKSYAREMIERMTDEERQDFFAGIDKLKLWEMAEGKPDAKTSLEAIIEHTVNREEINKALDDIL